MRSGLIILYSFLHPVKHGFLFILKNVLFKEINDTEISITFSNKTPARAYPWNAQTVSTNCPVTVNFKYR